jgi:regulatory protein
MHYVGRYATTRHKLVQYLARKVRERGWEDEKPADPAALAERFAELGYVDDAGYARSKEDSLLRRGYGPRRVDQALYAAGIAEADRPDQNAPEPDIFGGGLYGESAPDDPADQRERAKLAAAVVLARKKRVGPFATEPAEADKRRKQLQAFIRAGHDFAVARHLVFSDDAEGIGDDMLRDLVNERR